MLDIFTAAKTLVLSVPPTHFTFPAGTGADEVTENAALDSLTLNASACCAGC